MKKAAIFAAAAALVLSLAACGGQGDKNQNGAAGGTDPGVNSGDVNGGATNGSTNGATNGTTNGSTSSDNGVNANGSTRSSIGSDVRRGLDNMGGAVEDMWDNGRRAVDDAARGSAGSTSFQRMLDNARVTDVDGNMDGSASGRW